MPLVTVVIAAHNEATVIGRSLRALLADAEHARPPLGDGLAGASQLATRVVSVEGVAPC